MTGYIHGYDDKEQARLFEQAELLTPYVFDGVKFPPGARIIEPGCGVGAQTRILFKNDSSLHVTALDLSPSQIQTAKLNLGSETRVTLLQGSALATGFPVATFDGAFVCWLLEHIPQPISVLHELHRVLKPGSPIFISEVYNSFFRLGTPASEKIWSEFNAHQTRLGGDAFVGRNLGWMLSDAGFQNIQLRPRVQVLDNRSVEQKKIFLDYWRELIRSAEPALLKSGLINSDLISAFDREIEFAKNSPTAVFTWGFFQASAERG